MNVFTLIAAAIGWGLFVRERKFFQDILVRNQTLMSDGFELQQKYAKMKRSNEVYGVQLKLMKLKIEGLEKTQSFSKVTEEPQPPPLAS
jgi:hypothetical protein